MKKKYWILALFLFFAFLLRFFKQTQIPAGFHRDEASIGYNAYSILKTGKDEWGEKFPLYFKSFGDYPPGVYQYFTIPFIAIFGLTPLSVRLPAIILGSLLVLLVYIFALQLLNNEKKALLAAFFTVFSPWLIVQARCSSEVILALFFSLLGFIFYNQFFRSKKKIYLSLMSFVYLLALFSYNAARISLPLLHLLLSVKHRQQKNKNFVLASTIIVFIVSLILVFVSSKTAIRFNSVSIFNILNQENLAQAELYQEGIFKIPLLISRIFHNKYYSLFQKMIENLFLYLQPNFFIRDSGLPKRYQIPSSGVILLINFLVLIFWLIFTKDKKTKNKYFFLTWILLSLAAGLITSEDMPHVRRIGYVFVILPIILADTYIYIFNNLTKKFLKKLLLFFSVSFFLFNFVEFSLNYFVHSNFTTVNARSYGYQKLFNKLKIYENQYNKLMIMIYQDTPYIFYLFYDQYPPQEYQIISHNNKTSLLEKNKEVWNIGNYYFYPGSKLDLKSLENSTLYVGEEDAINYVGRKFIEIVDQVKMPSGLTKYYLFKQK